jgi:short-subunit dehydrogenase
LEFYDDILHETQDLDVAILVNNVGMAKSVTVQKEDIQHSFDIITVNTYPQTILSEEFRKRMLKRAGKSAIVNLSSITGGKPFSINPLYSATKGFNDFLSIATSVEYEDQIDYSKSFIFNV